MVYLFYFFAIVIGYLIGSLNFSLIIGKVFYKTDVREHGSKNAGATNTLRTLGTKAGIAVLILDTLKAVMAYFIVKMIPGMQPSGAYLAAAAASIGHNYPIFFGFKGGKGVTVSLGAVFCINPLAGALTLLTGVIVIAFSKYVSLGSMTAAIVSPVFMFFIYNGAYKPLAIILNIILALQILIRHRNNIKNLINHNERKLSFKKK